MDVTKEEKKELVVAYKEASALNDFETPYVPKVAEPLMWSIEKYKVAELLAFSGKTKKAIAKELMLPVAIINKWCSNSEFMDSVHEMVGNQIKHMKNNRLMVLNKILQAKIELAEIEGYADATRKDIVEVAAELRKETEGDTSKDSNYARLLEKLIFNQPTQVINVGAK